MLMDIDKKIAQVEVLTGYVFANKLLAVEAVQMAGPQVAIIHDGSFQCLLNNKRLSILGDTILTKVLCGLWFNARNSRNKGLDPSHWTTLRNDMLSNDSLAQRGYALKVDDFVHCNTGTVVSAKMVAAALEAIIGAIYQDGGDDAALRVVEELGFTEHRFLMIPGITGPGIPWEKQHQIPLPKG